MDNTIKVRVETIDGSAVETEDYIGVNEILTFEPGEKEKEVRLELNLNQKVLEEGNRQQRRMNDFLF